MERKLWQLFGQIGNERGKLAEKRVKLAFIAEDNRKYFPDWVYGFERASFKEDRCKGIDGWIKTDVGKIPLQIKSSFRGKSKAEQKFPDIPIIVLEAGISDENIIRQCCEIITPVRDYYLSLRRESVAC